MEVRLLPVFWKQKFVPFFFFFPKAVACEILVPRPGIEPTPLTLEVQSLNPWTPRNPRSFALAFASIKWRVASLVRCFLWLVYPLSSI